MSEAIERVERALAVINRGQYPLPWQVERRCYDGEHVVASGNIVVAAGFACAGNTELRKALVDVVNGAAELIAAMKTANSTEGA